jgi:hypothetical protein
VHGRLATRPNQTPSEKYEIMIHTRFFTEPHGCSRDRGNHHLEYDSHLLQALQLMAKVYFQRFPIVMIATLDLDIAVF